MHSRTVEITVKGQPARVAAVDFESHTVICEGSWLKMARVFDEPWLSRPPFDDARQWIEMVRQSPLHPDIVTFSQRLPDTTPRYAFPLERESVAVADTSSFKTWWDALPQESRKNVRQSQKRGVRVAPVAFTDELVHGIKSIYDETPIRQGRRFWHYNKSLETVRHQNSSYLDRSEFIGAYLEDELIGFTKFVRTYDEARIMQILSKEQYYDKHPMNAMLTAAVDRCSATSVTRLIYGQYIYGNKRASSVTEFKRRNGFHEFLVPRFYVPFTLKGRIAMATGVFRGFGTSVPEPLLNTLLAARRFFYRKLASRTCRRIAPA